MQALLAKLGYRLSSVIHDLDPGDPELVYVKNVFVNFVIFVDCSFRKPIGQCQHANFLHHREN
jgi:hypothetical protein